MAIKQFKSRNIMSNPTSSDFNILQGKLENTLQPLTANLSNDCNLIDVSLVSGTNSTINHKLGRKLSGWEICRKDEFADIKEIVSNTASLTLILVSNADVNITIRVF